MELLLSNWNIIVIHKANLIQIEILFQPNL